MQDNLIINNEKENIDVSSSEDFFLVKSEVNKLDKVNVQMVESICIKLLSKKSIDLRLFSYLIFSCLLKEDDLDRWSQAIKAMLSCLIRDSENFYPKKLSARSVALSWLNQDRIKYIFISRIENIDRSKLLKYHELICRLNQWLYENDNFCDPVIKLNFEQWLKKQISKFTLHEKKEPESKSVEEKEKTEIDSIKPCFSKKSVDTQVNNITELTYYTNLITDYCESQGRLIQAAAYRRALRWSSLMPRVDTTGVTGLSDLSTEDKSLLARCEEEYLKKPKEIYPICEKLLLVPGGQINLDIQYYAIKSSEQFDEALSVYIKYALFTFLKRFPSAQKWKYNNQVPCTSQTVVEWIEKECIIEKSINSNKHIIKNNDDRYDEVLKKRDLYLLNKICDIH